MNKFYVSLISFAVAALFVSCQSKYPGFEKTKSGLYYKFHQKNEGAAQPKTGDFLALQLYYHTDSDTVIFDNRNTGNLAAIQLTPPLFKGDVSEGLTMMCKGDSATFIIKADSFFYLTNRGGKMPEFIKDETMLYFHIKLVDFMDSAAYFKQMQEMRKQQIAYFEELKNKEPELIEKYIKDNKINLKPTASGLYFQTLKAGKGAMAKNGQLAKTHFILKSIDGALIQSSYDGKTTLDFTIGSEEIIPAWNEAIVRMNVGAKVLIVVPSALAYGAEGIQNVLMPYTPLVYEIELIELK